MKIRQFLISPPERDMPIQDGTRFLAQAGGGATTEISIFTAHQPVIVKAIKFSFDGAVTGAATNNAALTVNRYNNAGVLQGVVGVVTFAVATNATVFSGVDLSTLAGTPLTNIVLARGDVLTLKAVQNGTGLAVPAGKVEVNYSISGSNRY